VEDWGAYPPDAPELVALGGDLAPESLLAAYRAGVFPWPAGGLAGRIALRRRYRAALRAGLIRHRGRPGWALPWFSPQPRAVIVPARLHVSRSLRAKLRRCGWTTSTDLAFDAVVAGCADRADTWITPALAAAYRRLHAAGAAHSIEVWSAERLVGGLYGVAVGGVFSGESMFHLVPDASKVALVDLAERFATGGGVLIDCQTPTEHLLGLGQQVIDRAEFRELLGLLADRPARLSAGRLPVSRLLRRRPEDPATPRGRSG
jgi:leucyl/phenylalanyl-tRNA--protein transferase